MGILVGRRDVSKGFLVGSKVGSLDGLLDGPVVGD